MIRDLRLILEGWEYEPDKISVRKIIGRDGKEKIQTRVDLGVLQFEATGRPDGARPHGCESMLEFQERRLAEWVRQHGNDEGFSLTPEQCRELRYEAHLYYQRYLSLFVLEEFEAVARDTARNLRMIDLCQRYAREESDRELPETQRAYVMMMNARARAYRALQTAAFDTAMNVIDAAIEGIENLVAGEEDSELDNRTELRVLHELRTEILRQMPPDAAPRLRWELDEAIAAEDYIRAARLRDRLRNATGATHVE